MFTRQRKLENELFTLKEKFEFEREQRKATTEQLHLLLKHLKLELVKNPASMEIKRKA